MVCAACETERLIRGVSRQGGIQYVVNREQRRESTASARGAMHLQNANLSLTGGGSRGAAEEAALECDSRGATAGKSDIMLDVILRKFSDDAERMPNV